MMFVVSTPDMSGAAKLHVSTNSNYNNEASCNEAGAMLSKQLAEKLPATAKVMFTCQSIDYEDIKKALPPLI